jgi:hypothetical protein
MCKKVIIFIDKFNMSQSTSSSASDSSTHSLTPEQYDRYFEALSKVVFSTKAQNIGIISCLYSSNVYVNKITDFMYLNGPDPTMFFIPLFHSGRMNLMVFYLADKKIGYYDSLKQPRIYSFTFAKTAIEQYLNLSFVFMDQEKINSTINYNPIPDLSNFHLLRIAEEIAFHGKNQKLIPFDAIIECQRIKKIMEHYRFDKVGNDGR